MPTIPVRRRPLVGWSLTAAGALVLIAIVVVFVAPTIPFDWVFDLSALALVVAFVAIGTAEEGARRFAFAAAAAGWLIIAAASLLFSAPGIVGLVAEVIALLGGLAAGVLVMSGRTLGRRADLIFLIAMILGALYLLDSILSLFPLAVYVLLTLLYGAAVFVTGILVLRKASR